MTDHERFRYTSLDELSAAIESMELDIPLSSDSGVLREPLALGKKIVPNRIAIHPMEGCDGTAEGTPGELTYRRYHRFAVSGAGLIWFEATAVIRDGRANPRQLLLTKDTQADMKRLLDSALRDTVDAFGSDGRPYTVLQLTHSGRYSRPVSEPRPVILAKNPYLYRTFPEAFKIISDEELEELEDVYADAAVLAGEIGFDAVDIKSCHRYLISEILSGYTRDGRYGGSFENRTRFLLNIVDKIAQRTSGELDVTVRLNAYDAIPHPYGWGVDMREHRSYDITEPLRLVGLLRDRGMRLINITAGNPYFNPHVNRPYDTGPYLPTEHPLEGVGRMLGLSREVQKTAPEIAVVASGLTWLREYGANAAAGGVRDGWFALAGFGRQAFAYPDFPKDILEGRGMDRKKCCITCGKCSEIMRFDGQTGCVIRDADVYAPIYRQVSRGKAPLVGNKLAEHV